MSATGGNGSDMEDGNAILAGEYVLGLLTPDAARAIEQLEAADAAMAAAIAAWRARLEPLTDLPAPVAPSAALWSRIAAGIKAAPGPSALSQPAPSQLAHSQLAPSQLAPSQLAPSQLAEGVVAPAPAAANENTPGPWRALALAAAALAAGLAAFIWLGPQPAQAPWARAIALLSAPGTVTAGLRAQITAAGTITVVPLQAITTNPGEQLGFWAWPRDHAEPVLLGMISPSGGQLRYPFAVQDGTPVMVTREPASGPRGKPGPTLFLGLLASTS